MAGEVIMTDLSKLSLKELKEHKEELLFRVKKAYDAAHLLGIQVEQVDKEFGVRIKEIEDIRDNANTVHKIIKEVKEPKVCGFNKAWANKCDCNVLLENGQCEDHQKLCSCGKLATRECANAGQFVCGRPLCDNCTCNHGSF